MQDKNADKVIAELQRKVDAGEEIIIPRLSTDPEFYKAMAKKYSVEV